MPLLDKAGAEICIIYHPNDKLAEMIAAAWTDTAYRDRLLNDTANVFRESGIFVKDPIVVTEAQFKTRNFNRDQDMVFVLPDAPPEKLFEKSVIQGNLIETARVKMAYTCTGI
jgi:hypothetical protein